MDMTSNSYHVHQYTIIYIAIYDLKWLYMESTDVLTEFREM